MNDDEGPYSPGTGRIAFYDGGDAGGFLSNGQPTANHTNFEAAANYYYDEVRDVRSWAQLLAALEEYVNVHGRVSEIAIIDHGSPAAPAIGNDVIGLEEWLDLPEYLNDGALIWLFGCDVAADPPGPINGRSYCDWVSDAAAPNAPVKAAAAFVQYHQDGHVTVDPPAGDFEIFDGLDTGYHP